MSIDAAPLWGMCRVHVYMSSLCIVRELACGVAKTWNLQLANYFLVLILMCGVTIDVCMEATFMLHNN